MAHINNRLNQGDNVEKFPIFEIETTENKITIHGAVGSIVFYDYDRAEAVKQYKSHCKIIIASEKINEAAYTFNEAAEKMKRLTETLTKAFSIFGGIHGI